MLERHAGERKGGKRGAIYRTLKESSIFWGTKGTDNPLGGVAMGEASGCFFLGKGGSQNVGIRRE